MDEDHEKQGGKVFTEQEVKDIESGKYTPFLQLNKDPIIVMPKDVYDKIQSGEIKI